jgi:hypothetical protein
LDYLDANNFSYISLEYDQFTKDPAASINKLNAFMEMELKKDAWDKIYKKPASFSRYKRAILAYLIYIKNFNSRIK